jgi:hypothetical protein
MIKYRCRKCLLEVPQEVYESNRYCPNPNCGTYLEKVVISDPPKRLQEHGRKKLTPGEAYIDKLWPVYINSQIEISVGFTFPSVAEWVARRKQVYQEYRKKFKPINLENLNSVKNNFHSWLLFRNNLSWTTFQRTASNALEHPQKLAKLLFTLQNEDIEIESRVRSGLQGTDKIDGIGQGIVTALLHTFNDEKHGVWNSRTTDTLRKLHRPTFPSDDLAESYKRVNQTLTELAKELETDLTTLDGFMWFVSKNYEFL